ncbi:MAG: hypothetical protein IKE61_01450 [Coriobacteriales bacterium]|nr:hypothetical protein [Coriobacteriales bacterium]
MKKILSIVFAAVLALASMCALAGCGGGSAEDQYVGTWVIDALEDESLGGYIEYSTVESAVGKSAEDFSTLVLNQDGSLSWNVMGQDMFSTYASGVDVTWKASDSGVKLFANGEDAYDLSFDQAKGQLKVEANGSTIYYVKK